MSKGLIDDLSRTVRARCLLVASWRADSVLSVKAKMLRNTIKKGRGPLSSDQRDQSLVMIRAFLTSDEIEAIHLGGAVTKKRYAPKETPPP